MKPPRQKLLRWLVGALVFGGMSVGMPALGAPAGAAPGDHNPQHTCREQGGSWLGSQGACVGGDNSSVVPDDDDGTTAECTYKPPFGEKGRDWADAAGPGDIPNVHAGAAAEILRLLGVFNETETIDIPEDVAEEFPWYVTELRDEGECHLADRLPHPGCWARVGGSREQEGRLEHQLHEADYDAMIPDLCWGSYPNKSYDIGYDAGGLTELSNKLWGWPTALFFKVGQWSIRLSFWLMGEAQSFDINATFGDAVEQSFENLDAELVEGLTLTRLAWLALVGYMAFAMVRGKVALAGGELVITIVMLSLAGLIMANPRGYMEGSSELMTGLSNQVLSAAATEDAQENCDNRLRDGWEGRYPGMTESLDNAHCSWTVNMDLQRRLHRLFVEIPYDYINWGTSLEGHACSDRRDHILSTGPHGTDPWPRDYMRKGPEECGQLAVYNEQPNGDRLLNAMVSGLAAAALAIVLGMAALTILLAKFVTAMLFAVAPLAAVAVILPSSGRRLAWVWATTAVQAIVVVVGMSGILAVGLLLIVPTLETALDAGGSPFTAYLIVAGPLGVMWIGRRKMLSGLKGMSDNFAERMSRFNPGSGSSGFAGASFAGGGGGGGGGGNSLFGAPRAENMTQGLTVATTGATAAMAGAGVLGRAAGRTLRFHTAPIRAGGRSIGKRLTERRVANRTLQNNMATNMLDRKRASAGGGSAGGGGGGGASGRNTFGVPEDIWDGMKPRYKRMRERHHEADEGVANYRANHARRFWSPVVEWGIRRWTVGTRALVGDHSLVTRSGLRTRSQRTGTGEDAKYALAPGRAGTLASKETARHGSRAWARQPDIPPRPPDRSDWRGQGYL